MESPENPIIKKFGELFRDKITYNLTEERLEQAVENYFQLIYKGIANGNRIAMLSRSNERLAISEIDINHAGDLNIRQSEYHLLSVSFLLPSFINYDEFLIETNAPIRSLDNTYRILSLVENAPVEKIINSLAITDLDERTLQVNTLTQELNLSPLQLLSMHYGSPASFDFLGAGKILEILREILIDISWRGKHMKLISNLEREDKQAQLQKAQLDMEKTSNEIAKQKLEIEKDYIEIIEKKINLLKQSNKLRKKERDIIVSAMLPNVKTINDSKLRLVHTPNDDL